MTITSTSIVSHVGMRFAGWVIACALCEHGTRRLWLAHIMERRPIKVAAVALANKIARMAWA
jgi:transposase